MVGVGFQVVEKLSFMSSKSSRNSGGRGDKTRRFVTKTKSRREGRREFQGGVIKPGVFKQKRNVVEKVVEKYCV